MRSVLFFPLCVVVPCLLIGVAPRPKVDIDTNPFIPLLEGVPEKEKKTVMTYSVCLQCSCTEQTKTLQIYFQLVTLFALSEFLLRQTCGEVCLSVLCLIYFLLLLNLCISDSKHAETKTHTHKRKVHIHRVCPM